MKREFTLTRDNVAYPVVVEGETITVNGRPFTVEVAEDGVVLVDGIAYDVALEGEMATIGGESYAVQVSGLAVTRLSERDKMGCTRALVNARSPRYEVLK